MTRCYLKSALKNKRLQMGFIAIFIALPLVFGYGYGLMYESLFKTSSPQVAIESTVNTERITVLTPANQLSAIAQMQLSVFSGMSFFLVSFFAAKFVKGRRNQMTNRLVAMGYTKRNVFLGEGISFLLVSTFMVAAYHFIFSWIHQVNFSVDLISIIQFFLLIILQALFATSYSLFALGVFKTEKNFSLFHFLPAFVISFLGGAFFPVEQVSNGGIYQWMPTYHLNKVYESWYIFNSFEKQPLGMTFGVLMIASVLFLVVGYKSFKLEEVEIC